MTKHDIGYSMEAGLQAVGSLEKLLNTNANFASKKFVKQYTKFIHELDDKRTKLHSLTLSPKINAETKRKYDAQIEEIQLTFTELKRLSETIYDLMKNYPQTLPKPIENAWAIFGDCLWGALKIPFVFGFRAGIVFALKYGNVWQEQ